MIFGRTDTQQLIEIPDAEVVEGVPNETYLRERFRDLPPGPPPVVPLVITEEPEFNPSTQRLQDGLTWLEDQVQRTWEVVALSTAEVVGKAIAEGYLVDPEGIRLALHESDRTSFAQLLVLVREALDLEAITDDAPIQIADVTGTLTTVTALRFRQIMVGYGFYYKSLWDTALSGD